MVSSLCFLFVRKGKIKNMHFYLYVCEYRNARRILKKLRKEITCDEDMVAGERITFYCVPFLIRFLNHIKQNSKTNNKFKNTNIAVLELDLVLSILKQDLCDGSYADLFMITALWEYHLFLAAIQQVGNSVQQSPLPHSPLKCAAAFFGGGGLNLMVLRVKWELFMFCEEILNKNQLPSEFCRLPQHFRQMFIVDMALVMLTISRMDQVQLS